MIEYTARYSQEIDYHGIVITKLPSKASMDYGLLPVDYTLLREDPEEGQISPEDIRTLLRTTNSKLRFCRRIRSAMAIAIKKREKMCWKARMKPWFGGHGSNALCTLLTVKHVLDRYMLVLVRDIFRLQRSMTTVPLLQWRTWRGSVHGLGQRAPNVHEHYLYRTPAHRWAVSTSAHHATVRGVTDRLAQ